ncbi:MAG TPA: FAD-dependent oxidoreductase [Bacillales bacterium]
MKQLLLVGAGHAHLYVLKQLQKNNLPDVDVTLLSLSEYQYYSGMFAGHAEGLYTLDDIRADVRSLAEKAKVHLIKGAAVSIDPEQKMVLTDQGKVLDYDVVSFDIGSLTADTDRPGVLEHAETIKPNNRFPDVMERFRRAECPVIVGGGMAGTELALSVQTWRKQNRSGPLILVSDGGLLDSETQKAGEKAEALAREKGVTLHLHDRAEAIIDNKIISAANRKIPFDEILWLTGPRPHQMFSASLPVDEKGYLLVEQTLQVKRFPSVFGAGDCVSVNGFPHMGKAGFHALKQAPILWENLKGFFGKGQGQLYNPQSPFFLSILSTGGRRGLMLYKEKVFYGKWVWQLKHQFDRHFVKNYQ